MPSPDAEVFTGTVDATHTLLVYATREAPPDVVLDPRPCLFRTHLVVLRSRDPVPLALNDEADRAARPAWLLLRFVPQDSTGNTHRLLTLRLGQLANEDGSRDTYPSLALQTLQTIPVDDGYTELHAPRCFSKSWHAEDELLWAQWDASRHTLYALATRRADNMQLSSATAPFDAEIASFAESLAHDAARDRDRDAADNDDDDEGRDSLASSLAGSLDADAARGMFGPALTSTPGAAGRRHSSAAAAGGVARASSHSISSPGGYLTPLPRVREADTASPLFTPEVFRSPIYEETDVFATAMHTGNGHSVARRGASNSIGTTGTGPPPAYAGAFARTGTGKPARAHSATTGTAAGGGAAAGETSARRFVPVREPASRNRGHAPTELIALQCGSGSFTELFRMAVPLEAVAHRHLHADAPTVDVPLADASHFDGLNLRVVPLPSGAVCFCVQQPGWKLLTPPNVPGGRAQPTIWYTVHCPHWSSSLTLPMAVPFTCGTRAPPLAFAAIGTLLVALVPGGGLDLISCGQEHEPVLPLRLYGRTEVSLPASESSPKAGTPAAAAASNMTHFTLALVPRDKGSRNSGGDTSRNSSSARTGTTANSAASSTRVVGGRNRQLEVALLSRRTGVAYELRLAPGALRGLLTPARPLDDRVRALHIALVHQQDEGLVRALIGTLRSEQPALLDRALLRELVVGLAFLGLRRRRQEPDFLRHVPATTVAPWHQVRSFAFAPLFTRVRAALAKGCQAL